MRTAGGTPIDARPVATASPAGNPGGAAGAGRDARHGARAFAHSSWRWVKVHPLPTLTIGLGLGVGGWLVEKSHRQGIGRLGRRAAAGVRKQERAARRLAREQKRHLARSAAAARQSLGRRATRLGKRIEHDRRALRRLVDERPLVLGLTMLACGLSVGLLLPVSRREKDLLGAAGDEVRDGAKHTATASLEWEATTVRSAIDRLGDDTVARVQEAAAPQPTAGEQTMPPDGATR